MLRSIFVSTKVKQSLTFVSKFCTNARRPNPRGKLLLSYCVMLSTYLFLTIDFVVMISNNPTEYNCDINDVKIIGMLMSDTQVLQSGTKQFTVKTRESNSKYSIHKVHIKTYADFKYGQRVYVGGKLSSTAQKVENGMDISSTIVKAHNVYALEEINGLSKSECEDKNSVEILAHIASDIFNKEDNTAFYVATNFKQINERGEEVHSVHFHSVFTYDDDVREYIQNHLTKKDRVLIFGKIGHQMYTGENGKRLHSGFIEPTNIFKITRPTMSHAKSNENDMINDLDSNVFRSE